MKWKRAGRGDLMCGEHAEVDAVLGLGKWPGWFPVWVNLGLSSEFRNLLPPGGM